MDNNTIVFEFPNIESRRAHNEELARQAADARRLAEYLEQSLADDTELLKALDRTTEIHDGVALRIERGKQDTYDETGVSAVGRDITRSARVYLSQHNKVTFGIILHDTPDWGRHHFPYPGGTCMGTTWEYDEAMAAARAWTAHGTICERKTYA